MQRIKPKKRGSNMLRMDQDQDGCEDLDVITSLFSSSLVRSGGKIATLELGVGGLLKPINLSSLLPRACTCTLVSIQQRCSASS